MSEKDYQEFLKRANRHLDEDRRRLVRIIVAQGMILITALVLLAAWGSYQLRILKSQIAAIDPPTIVKQTVIKESPSVAYKPLVGPVGEPGGAGPIGPIGQTGPAGQQGEPGKDGIDGKNGKDGKDGRDGKTPELTLDADCNLLVSYAGLDFPEIIGHLSQGCQ